ncbi:dTDP-4-dehydrorhamnose reductase [Waterburya agarophytonicola K14]|uniref:dTDP-4-dehydrorhamnose reductase n=1 Tax=Waterburya agarophytonicola KI4 TaxID=2874699 RepID=A0A964BMF6_9CYAN|nr:dTDP-4-dehydrorhamnose reductase [Waterburya agarophytonicola KI4]
MTKILLTGITGQVGQELSQTLKSLGQVIEVTRQDLDLTQPDRIKQKIAQIKPDIIVNAAAYTAVDKAEEERKLAIAINGNAPKAIAIAAQDIGTTVVHISTDYVFNGQNHTPYLESDGTNPLGVYGNSKLLGETGVRENCDRHIILRTAWVYGSRGHGNFVKTMLRLGENREELKVVADQIGSPTWSYDIAKAIANLLNKSKEDPTINGTYHFSNSGVASWYDLAVATFTEAKQLGFPLKIQQVIPITTADYPTPAQRPNYSVLAKGKYTAATEVYPPHWRESLKAMLTELHKLSN